MPRKSKDSTLKTYRVGGTMTISMYIDVQAKSPEEAMKLAEGAPVMSLCHQCASGEGFGVWNTSGELDGNPDVNEGDEVIEL